MTVGLDGVIGVISGVADSSSVGKASICGVKIELMSMGDVVWETMIGFGSISVVTGEGLGLVGLGATTGSLGFDGAVFFSLGLGGLDKVTLGLTVLGFGTSTTLGGSGVTTGLDGLGNPRTALTVGGG